MRESRWRMRDLTQVEAQKAVLGGETNKLIRQIAAGNNAGSERRKKTPKEPILTDEFADKTHKFFAKLSDDTKIYDLLIPGRKGKERNVRVSPDYEPMTDWLVFHKSIKGNNPKGFLANLMNKLFDSRFETIGEVREMRVESLYEVLIPESGKKRFSKNSADFLKKIFPTPPKK